MGLFDFFSGGSHPHHDEVYKKKVPLTHELLAGAAGFEALRIFEDQQAKKTGQAVHHSLFKDLLAGFAAAEVDKLVESRGFSGDKEAAKREAIAQAHAAYDKQYGNM